MDCGDRCGVGNAGERWNVWGLGVVGYDIYNIYINIYRGLWGFRWG